MTLGVKLNALGVSMALIFSHYFPVLFVVGAILSAIGIFMLFADK